MATPAPTDLRAARPAVFPEQYGLLLVSLGIIALGVVAIVLVLL